MGMIKCKLYFLVMKIFKILILFFLIGLQIPSGIAFSDKVEGLEFVVRKIDAPPLDDRILKRFDLYEIYFENRSDRTFSLPGYSVDLGIDYSSVSEVVSFQKEKSSKKLAALNIAAGAASIALGGIARSAASTALRIGNFRKGNLMFNDEKYFLSANKTYVIYPDESLSLFFFVDKFSGQSVNSIRFICRDEVLNLTSIVINKNLHLESINAKKDVDENVIAVPNIEQYK